MWTSMPVPRFFFAAMSPYSWLAAERIEQVVPQARWQIVLAGVLFSAHGRTSWGLTDERAAGLADCEARAAERGLGPIRWPEAWPSNDLTVARGILFAETLGSLRPFALAAMRLAFLEGAELSELDTVLEAGRRVGIDADELARGVADPAIKENLRAINEQALALGVFGVPTLAAGSELFWGDDRLEDAAQYLRDQAPA
jgi:2-hydroxychromene-2-carboxylate isomerase